METFSEHPLSLVLNIGNMLMALAVFLFLTYTVQTQSFSSRTVKYKFVSQREGKAMRGAAALLAGALAFYAYVLMCLSMGITHSYGYVFTALAAVGIGYALGKLFWSYLSLYHPFILEKRLNDIRFGPMKSPISGLPMTLLNETQEDRHLSKEMIAEEESLSVDYDVWIDEANDYKVIERYDTRYHSLVCEACNFRTLMERKEEVVTEPQLYKKGLLRKHYECSYCGHVEAKDIELSSLSEENKFAHYQKDVMESKKIKHVHV